MIGLALITSLASAAAPAIQTPQDTLPPPLVVALRALEVDSVDEAMKLAERYTLQAPRDPRGFLVLGDAYARRMPAGRFRAIEAYRAAETLARNDPAPSYRIARMGLWLGGDDGERIARDALERVVALDPFYRDAWDLWLTVYRNAGNRKKMVN